MSPKLLILFLTGFHWRIFFFHGPIDFVLFLILAWRILESFVSQLIFLSLTRSKMAMVRLPAMNPAQKLNFFLFTSAEGKGAPLPFWGPSQSFGFSLFPLPMSGDLRSLSTNTWSPLRDPHSFLTVTCLTAWYCQFKYGRIVLVLPLRLRELSRDNYKCYIAILDCMQKMSSGSFENVTKKN